MKIEVTGGEWPKIIVDTSVPKWKETVNVATFLAVEAAEFHRDVIGMGPMTAKPVHFTTTTPRFRWSHSDLKSLIKRQSLLKGK